MKKKEFLDLLRFYLRNLPENVIDDIIADYNEHFECAIELGRTEEEISKELGSPEKLAEEYYNFDNYKQYNKSKDNGKGKSHNITSNADTNKLLKYAFIGLGVLIGGPILLSIAISVAVFLLSLLGVGIFLIILSFIVLFNINIYGLNFYMGLVSSIFAFIFLLSSGVGMIYGSIKLIKLVYKSINKFLISFRWKNYRKNGRYINLNSSRNKEEDNEK